MRILAVNGAANKSRNTASMLKSAYDGAMSVDGGQGETVRLYDLDYKGCIGCHTCKLKEPGKLGRCAVKDGLSGVLEKAVAADVLLIGSPIYFNDLTGQTRSFLERFFFPAMTYNKERKPTYPKSVNVGWVFTMNAPAETYEQMFSGLAASARRIIGGESEFVTASGTKQFDDYSKYAASMFDVEAVEKRHAEQFPLDCLDAYEMGRRLALAVRPE